MNIHFEDKLLFEALIDSTLYSVQVGSAMYGLENQNSDTDILCIYYPHKNQLNSCFNNHHQLQYKDTETNTDYIFVDIITFVKNLMKGDSTINFEVINSRYIYDSIEDKTHFLSQLYEMKEEFYTFTVIRSYLGLARRDLNSLSKIKDPYLKWKKQCHIVRGRCIAKDILESNTVPLFFSHLKYRWKDLPFDHKYNSVGINKIREQLKLKLQNKEIVRFATVETQTKVDNLVQHELSNMKEFQLKVNPMYLFYPLNEDNNIKYE